MSWEEGALPDEMLAAAKAAIYHARVSAHQAMSELCRFIQDQCEKTDPFPLDGTPETRWATSLMFKIGGTLDMSYSAENAMWSALGVPRPDLPHEWEPGCLIDVDWEIDWDKEKAVSLRKLTDSRIDVLIREAGGKPPSDPERGP